MVHNSLGVLTSSPLDCFSETGFEPQILLVASFYRCYESTDPRDKIYALLGLLECRRQDNVLVSKPNCSISAQELYRDFARYFILKGNINNIMEKCGGPRLVQEMAFADNTCAQFSSFLRSDLQTGDEGSQVFTDKFCSWLKDYRGIIVLI